MNCRHSLVCTYRRARRGPIQYCEEYEEGSWKADHVAAIVDKHHADRGEDYFDVHCKRRCIDVFDIERELCFSGECSAAGYLSKAGHAGLYQQPSFLCIVPFFDLRNVEGSWADECHAAYKNVKQLRQFVEIQVNEA